MKVLKSGREAYVAECDRCGCVVSYGKGDVAYEGPQWDQNVFLICPECLHNIYLPILTAKWMTRKEYEDGKN